MSLQFRCFNAIPFLE